MTVDKVLTLILVGLVLGYWLFHMFFHCLVESYIDHYGREKILDDKKVLPFLSLVGMVATGMLLAFLFSLLNWVFR